MTGRIDEVVTKTKTVTLTMTEREAKILNVMALFNIRIPEMIAGEHSYLTKEEIKTMFSSIRLALYGL